MKKFIDYLNVGTKVKCLSYGEGVVSEIKKFSRYPVRVEFQNMFDHSYTNDGFIFDDAKSPSLFLLETEITQDLLFQERGNIPKPNFQKGDLVWVRNRTDYIWLCVPFHSIHNDEYWCYKDQKMQNEERLPYKECLPFDERPF
jgi:hypothetical protein